MDNTHHIITASRNVGSTLRLPQIGIEVVEDPIMCKRNPEALRLLVSVTPGPFFSLLGRYGG
jgi:hypothetical protein